MPTQMKLNKWSAEEFHRLVIDNKPKIAVFDCDGTLWRGDAAYGFMVWSMEQGLVSRSTSDWMDARHRSYRAGHVSEEAICGEMVQIYSGLRDQELRAASAQFFREFMLDHIFDEMVSLVSGLRQAGVDIWAVSSTNKWVIAEGLRNFDIQEDHILAAEVKVENGLLTSDLIDVPTDEAKAVALRRVGISLPDAVFGNSIHDLAMMDMARNPFPVNPSHTLLEAAAERGWGYFMPKLAEIPEVGFIHE